MSLPLLLLQVQAGKAQEAIALDPVNVEDVKRDPLSELAVTAEEIERENPRDLKQLFADDPAIAVAGGSVASQKFYLHGIDQSKLNVQIDGAQQKSNMWHHNGNIIVNPLLLKAVRVDSAVSPRMRAGRARRHRAVRDQGRGRSPPAGPDARRLPVDRLRHQLPTINVTGRGLRPLQRLRIPGSS